MFTADEDDAQNELERRRAMRKHDGRETPRHFPAPDTAVSDEQAAVWAAARLRKQQAEGDRNRAQVEHLRRLIQEFKATYNSANPGDTAHLVAEMRSAGHPDVDGLVGAVHTRMSAATPKTRRGDL